MMEARESTVQPDPDQPVNDMEDLKTLFESNYTLAICYVLLALILSVVGVLGNSFILYVTSKQQRISEHSRMYIMNLAIGDLCVSGIAEPMCIAGVFLGTKLWERNTWLCVTVASLCLTVCICVFLNLVCLTVNRWFYICRRKTYDKIYTKLFVILNCIGCWIIGLIAESPNFFGWGGHYFDDKSHQCIWDRTNSRSYTLFVAIGLLSTPLVTLLVCNASILRTIWLVKRNVSKYIVQHVNSSKILVTMLAVFLVCWTPYVIVLLLDHDNTISMEAHLFATLLAHSHSSTPCIIYLCFKRDFRENLRKMFCRTNVVTPAEINSIDQTRGSILSASHMPRSQTLPCSQGQLIHLQALPTGGIS